MSFNNVSGTCGDDFLAENDYKSFEIKKYLDGYPRDADCWWNIKSQSMNEIILMYISSFRHHSQHIRIIVQVCLLLTKTGIIMIRLQTKSFKIVC